jgi:hypothetical protein
MPALVDVSSNITSPSLTFRGTPSLTLRVTICMTEYVVPIHAALRAVHITLGFAGLTLFWLIPALPKGTPLHRRCGGRS